MRKYIILIVLSTIFTYTGFSQGTVDIMVENPRIIDIAGTDYFYADIYAKKTSDWGTIASEQVLSNSSFYIAWNYTDGSSPLLVSYNTTLLPPAAYTVEVGTTGPTGIEKLYVDVTQIAAGPTWTTGDTHWLFTVRFETGGSSNNSLVAWNLSDSELTHYRFSTSGIVLTKTDYDSDCDIALNTNCWTGASTFDWNQGGNWSSGTVPVNTDDVIYPNNPTRDLTAFNSTTYGIVKDLRVNHMAQLTIPSNRGITVEGNIELKGGINIVLSGGTGVGTLSSALIPEGSITNDSYLEDGHIEVHRTLYYEATDVDYYQHQVAAPVSGAILGDWDMIHTNSYAYEFQAASQTWFNIYNPSRSTPSGYGFILSLYGIGSASTEDVIFTDNLYLTDISPNIEPGPSNVTLIGNPYTAPIDWDILIPLQSDVVNDVKVWNPAAGVGGNYVSYVQGTGGNLSARYIQPGQAFFVESANGSGNVFDISTNSRVQNIQPYLKSQAQNLLRIFTQGGNLTGDELYIRLKDGESVTDAYDKNHDGIEWPSSYGVIATELYTTSSDNVHLTIDARPLSPELTSVPVHFKAGVEGEYNLVADLESLESFSPGTDIFLEDTYMPEQAWIDLREFNTYEFNASPEDDYARFMIHFHIKDFGIDELAEKPINIHSERTDAIIMNNSGQIIREIQVYDIAGNLMTVKSGVSDDVTRMFVSSNTGYYVVKVITDKAVYSEKILITK